MRNTALNIFFFLLLLLTDYRRKRLEKSVNIENFRVSITNPSDSISQKGYSFKVGDNLYETEIIQSMVLNRIFVSSMILIYRTTNRSSLQLIANRQWHNGSIRYVFQLQSAQIWLLSKFNWTDLLDQSIAYASNRSHFATDLHPIDTDSESDHDGSINLNKYPKSASK